MKIKTQKAKGIMRGIPYLRNTFASGRLAEFFCSSRHKFIGNKEDIRNQYIYQHFARPCPLKPKHGFIDSRTVFNAKEVKSLWDDIKAQDPNGELVLGPYLGHVNTNAIYVSSGLMSIGRGNDGATAGKNSISFPMAPETFNKTLFKKSGMAGKDSVYLESVSTLEDRYLVQVRGGPAVDNFSKDYIPRFVKVKKVIYPCDDLVKWEKVVAKLPPDTVVYAKGHTLASHAAIHCLLNKIPFITTHQPKVGMNLYPTENRKLQQKINTADFKLGVQAALKLCNDVYTNIKMNELFMFSISVLHNWAYLKHSEHSSWLLGSASTIFAKLSTSLSLGEYRHSKRFIGYKDRDDVYMKSMRQRSSHLDLPKVFRAFYFDGWEDGFGGLPWATCTWYSCKLWSAIADINNSNVVIANKEKVKKLISLFNKVTNLAHNGGWWFNKISSKDVMNFTAKHPGLAAYSVSDIYLRLFNLLKKSKPKKLNKPIIKYSPCKHINNNNLVWLIGKPIFNHNKHYIELSLKLENGKSYRRKIKVSESNFYKIDEKCLYKFSNFVVLKIGSKNKFTVPNITKSTINKTFGKVI